jgi:hypothetical protein
MLRTTDLFDFTMGIVCCYRLVYKFVLRLQSLVFVRTLTCIYAPQQSKKVQITKEVQIAF